MVNKVRTSNGIISNQQTILKELTFYYKNMKIIKTKVNLHFKEKIKSLSMWEQVKCKDLITEKEVLNILKDMKNGKSPGIDSYTAEFYNFFWKDIGNFHLESLNKSFTTGELSITQKQGLITLLPKGNKPKELIKNCRPITQLNVDYKLLPGVLAYRMKEVLLRIIQSEQKGFLKIVILGKYLDKSRFPRMYKMKKDFRTWFSILYKNSNICVINNGFLQSSLKL